MAREKYQIIGLNAQGKKSLHLTNLANKRDAILLAKKEIGTDIPHVEVQTMGEDGRDLVYFDWIEGKIQRTDWE